MNKGRLDEARAEAQRLRRAAGPGRTVNYDRDDAFLARVQENERLQREAARNLFRKGSNVKRP